MDDLFVRHTYLTAVIGMVVQARHSGIDIRQLAENDPFDLLYGRRLPAAIQGIQGVVESDFFAWPAEVGGRAHAEDRGQANRPVQLAERRLQRCGRDPIRRQSSHPTERRQLGEYYTPGLARQDHGP